MSARWKWLAAFSFWSAWTRISGIPLLIVIAAAIATAKLRELHHANQEFWYMVSDARTDFAILFSLLFLIVSRLGFLSIDALRRQ